MNFLVHFKRIITTGLFVGAVFCCASVHGMSSSSNQNQEQLNAQLIAAAKNNNLLQAQEALLAGAAVDVQDKYGWTPLYWAAGRGCVESVKLLLEKNAVVDVKTNSGWTPLHIAAWNGKIEVVKLLLENNAAVNAQDKDGWTQLHKAVEFDNYDNIEVVKLLLEKNAAVDVKNNDGCTPLHRAAWRWRDRVEFVQLLVENGANIDLINKEQKTAYHIAVESGHQNVADYLQQVAHYYATGTRVPLSQRDALTPNYFILSLLSEKYDDLETNFDEQVACGKTPNITPFIERARRLNKVQSLEKLKWLHRAKKYKEHNDSIQKKLWQCATSPQFDDVIVNTQGE